MMWTISTIIAVALLVFVSYLLYVALNRITQYENYILQFQRIIEFATDKMKQVDASGHYESDDETGFFFSQIKELQTVLNELFEEDVQVGKTTKK
jgi:hypothetical protein|tara:strand:- start:7290 stop:7574 length:285 start_codon:yes stop_codon:yes gene_type:complete